MQAYSVIPEEPGYTPGNMGRPAKTHRTAFGERLFLARTQAGLSQAQVAEKLAITQQSYAGWERRETALKPDHLAQLAAVLGVTIEHLLGANEPRQRGAGPVGKAKAVFARVSALPRDQQKHVLRVVEDMLVAHQVRKAG
jgi:transcriptional regulator with XRE-family HTH domain